MKLSNCKLFRSNIKLCLKYFIKFVKLSFDQFTHFDSKIEGGGNKWEGREGWKTITISGVAINLLMLILFWLSQT